MSMKSSKTNITEVAGVNNAVNQLQELGARMTSDEFGFKEEDVEEIDKIIDAIGELDSERLAVHNDLEVKTIEASVLRHTLHFLPNKVKAEIAAAVSSARNSNADELTRLQTELDKIKSHTDELEKEHNDLEKKNAILHPTKEKVRLQHEEIIMQLNQRMAEKAGKQIVLNETRDKLRDTNLKIVDLEDGIVQLKEDLIQERADARMEKKRLKKALYDTTLKTREQKEANVVKKKETDVLHEEVMKSEEKLDNLRKEIKRLDTSNARLQGQEKALCTQLLKEKAQNKELKVYGEDITKVIAEEEIIYEGKRVTLEENIKELEEAINEEEERHAVSTIKKDELSADLEYLMDVRKEDAEKVKLENEKLQEVKLELASKAEAVGRLTQENIDLEEAMEELADTHNAIVATLTKQIEEQREILAKERSDRLEMQSESDAAQKKVDDFRAGRNREMAEYKKRIKESELLYEQLQNEGTQLQRNIREDDLAIKRLKSEIELTEDAKARKQKDIDNDLVAIKNELARLENKVELTQKLHDKHLGPFLELEDRFAQDTENYTATKKKVAAKRIKAVQLQDNVKRATTTLEKMNAPTQPDDGEYAELQRDLKRKQQQSLHSLKRNGDELKDIESEIYIQGCKLTIALAENDNLRQANKYLLTELTEIETRIENNDSETDAYIDLIEKLRDELQDGWNEDRKLEKQFAVRDQALVDDLTVLLGRTEEREAIVSSVSDKLHTELDMLTSFLENVAKRRPKDTRQGSRSQSRLSRLSPTPSSYTSDTPGRTTPLPGRSTPITMRTTPLPGRVTPSTDRATPTTHKIPVITMLEP